MKLNELGDWIRDEDRGVSPVIGVILMVAITVILAAVIAAFVLDLGQSQGASASAGISFDQNGDAVNATINSIDRADSITVSSDGNCSVDNSIGSWDGTALSSGNENDDPSAGDRLDISSCDDGETITVIGSYDGDESVITTYDVDQ